MQTSYHESPVGTWVATWENDSLTRFGLVAQTKITQSFNARVAPSKLFQELDLQLRAYFSAKLTIFSIPYQLCGTDFQLAVWDELTKIKYGESATYSEIAQRVGRPLAVRAVGTAIGKNPLALLVPCHRVLGKHSLGGYAYGLACKQQLLQIETAAALKLDPEIS